MKSAARSNSAIFSGILLLVLLYGGIVYLLARMFYRAAEGKGRSDSGLPMDRTPA